MEERGMEKDRKREGWINREREGWRKEESGMEK